jgi:hypothetical protein
MRNFCSASGMRAAFSVPVLDTAGNCLGSLASHFKTPYTPSAHDLERQSVFAKLIAFALKRQELIEPIVPSNASPKPVWPFIGNGTKSTRFSPTSLATATLSGYSVFMRSRSQEE